MSTSIKKSLTYGKDYSFNVKANGYYDYLETKSITKETEDPINITLKEYDGLKYTIVKDYKNAWNKNENVLDFNGTVLPQMKTMEYTLYALKPYITDTMYEYHNQNGDVELHLIGCLDPDVSYTENTNISYNCFVKGSERIILTDKDSYEDYRYLGKIIFTSSSSSTPALKFGDRIDNKATVVGTFESRDLGTVVYAVVDAHYRGTNIAWSSGLKGVNTGVPAYGSSDDVLNAKESATYNTNMIVQNHNDEKIEAFRHVRGIGNLTFNNKVYLFQLPNAYELQQIYDNREKLDALDPTVTANSNKNLSNWGAGNSWSAIWSSNEAFMDGEATRDACAWVLDSTGSFYNCAKDADIVGVIPIIEIPVVRIPTTNTNDSIGGTTVKPSE